MAHEVSITRPSRTVVLKSAHSASELASEIPDLLAILGVRVVLLDDVDILASYFFERPAERPFPFRIYHL